MSRGCPAGISERPEEFGLCRFQPLPAEEEDDTVLGLHPISIAQLALENDALAALPFPIADDDRITHGKAYHRNPLAREYVKEGPSRKHAVTLTGLAAGQVVGVFRSA